MATSTRPRLARRSFRPAFPTRTGGFTLIELMVVVLIIGVLVGVVMIDFTDASRDRDVEREAHRLAAVLELARDRALISSEEWGLRLDGEEYSFHRLGSDGSTWQEIEDRPFARHVVEEGLAIDLQVERKRVKKDIGALAKGKNPPHLLVLSDGSVTPFEITVQRQSETRRRDYAPWRLNTDGIEIIRATRGVDES